jgi:serine/threonine-protein kinase RIO1
MFEKKCGVTSARNIATTFTKWAIFIITAFGTARGYDKKYCLEILLLILRVDFYVCGNGKQESAASIFKTKVIRTKVLQNYIQGDKKFKNSESRVPKEEIKIRKSNVQVLFYHAGNHKNCCFMKRSTV